MLMPWSSFRGRVLGGYVVAILPLAVAMAVTVAHIDENSATEIERLRSEQQEISLAEQVRWSAELLISAGRGYLIAGSPDLLSRIRRYETEFDRAVRELEQQALSATGVALVEDAERAAHEFRFAQANLLANRSSPDLVERFERELQPLGAALSHSLVELIEHKGRLLDEAFDEAQRARRDLVIWTFALLGTFTTVGLGLACYFAARLARAYRQQQQAVAASEQALQQRDELMGILAHDLRNPLNSIALRAAVLRQATDGGEVRRHADSIGAVTKGMAELVDSILDLSTIESGQLSLDARPLEVARVLDEVTEIYQGLAAAKQIRLERRCSGPDLLVLADRKRVIQVLSNLLGNAIKATPSQGSIGITTECDGATVRFGVWDTGPGIREEYLPHIFERRWTRESGVAKGTGLGLFIAKSIVDAHGGCIWNERAERRTIFRFTLPLFSPARGLADSTSSVAASSRSKAGSGVAASR
jgi:signal transduction histidine kinase